MASTARRLVLDGWGDSGDADAARVLDAAGAVVATGAEPAGWTDRDALREAIVSTVLDADFGDAVLAGVAFAPRLGGDAVGFT